MLEHGYKLGGGVRGSGTAGATNTLELAGSAGAAVAVNYHGLTLTNFQDVLFGAGGNDTLDVSNTSGTLGFTISGFGVTSDIIDLTAIGTNGTISNTDTVNHRVTISGSGGTVTLQLDASDATGFTSASDGAFGTDLAPCFVRGTMILAPDGEVAVEELAIGDRVMTFSGAAKPIRWIGRRVVAARFADPLHALPVRIMAGALDDGVPSRDLCLSPDHALLIDGALIQAGALVNGSSIVRERNVPESFTYYHVELADHDLLSAENTLAETFVDNVDRMGFDNWDEHLALYGETDIIVEMAYPRAKAHRQVPMATRARLAARAAHLYPSTAAA